MMNIKNPNIFPSLYKGIRISDGEARNLTDGFALAWIFFMVLAAGLLILAVNVFTTSMAAFSMMLGVIWWTLSHYNRR